MGTLRARGRQRRRRRADRTVDRAAGRGHRPAGRARPPGRLALVGVGSAIGRRRGSGSRWRRGGHGRPCSCCRRPMWPPRARRCASPVTTIPPAAPSSRPPRSSLERRATRPSRWPARSREDVPIADPVADRIEDAGCPVLAWTGGTAGAEAVLSRLPEDPALVVGPRGSNGRWAGAGDRRPRRDHHLRVCEREPVPGAGAHAVRARSPGCELGLRPVRSRWRRTTPAGSCWVSSPAREATICDRCWPLRSRSRPRSPVSRAATASNRTARGQRRRSRWGRGGPWALAGSPSNLPPEHPPDCVARRPVLP